MNEMEKFGVRFTFDNAEHLEALGRLYGEIKQDKDSGSFRTFSSWAPLVPTQLRDNFDWPDEDALNELAQRRASSPVVISEPEDHLIGRWDFYSVVDSINTAEYTVLGLEQAGENIAELQINPDCYPYGGIGALMALVQGFGFDIIGVNEYGKYHTRDELLHGYRAEQPPAPRTDAPWWKFWA